MRDHLNALDEVEPQPLTELFPGAPPAAIDLLHSMLQFQPGKRPTVEAALVDTFFEGMAMSAQLVASRPVDAATIDFEHSEIRLPQACARHAHVHVAAFHV